MSKLALWYHISNYLNTARYLLAFFFKLKDLLLNIMYFILFLQKTLLTTVSRVWTQMQTKTQDIIKFYHIYWSKANLQRQEEGRVQNHEIRVTEQTNQTRTRANIRPNQNLSKILQCAILKLRISC